MPRRGADRTRAALCVSRRPGRTDSVVNYVEFPHAVARGNFAPRSATPHLDKSPFRHARCIAASDDDVIQDTNIDEAQGLL